jgi:SPP1 family predicted phage head-tail adaptor
MIGDLRYRITIQQETLTTDSQGGSSAAWAELVTVWASIDPVSANQRWFAERLGHQVTHKIIIRNRADITSAMRIIYGSKTYYIHSYKFLDEGSGYLEIMASEGEIS